MAKAKEASKEVRLTRDAAAAYLEGLAAGLRRGSVRVRVGNQAFTLDIPARLALEVEVEREGREIELEVSLGWKGTASKRVPKLHIGPAE